MKTRIYILASLCLLMAACNQDDTAYPNGEDNTVRLSMPIEEWKSGRTATRADMSGMTAPVSASMPDDIGVFGYIKDGDWMKNINDEDLNNIQFTKQSDNNYHKGYWDASTSDAADGAFKWESKNYCFYAYSPYIDGKATFDQATTTFTLTNIPEQDATDRLVAAKLKEHNPSDNTNGGNVVKFTGEYMFKHIFACIQLGFAIDPEYAKLRYLDIRKVEASIDGSLQSGTYKHNASTGTGTWASSTADNTDPASSFTYTTPADEHWYLGSKTLTGIGTDNMHTPDIYHALGHFFIKEQKCADHPIKITVTYDVYDLKQQKTRSNVETSSSIILGGDNFVTKDNNNVKWLRPGYYYNVLINIVPDFLYVLSDNDNGADLTIKAGN